MKSNPCVLILVDGLRPDAIEPAPMPTVLSLAKECLYAGTAQSLMPNCTLPCHFSIFHSVVPERHGINTNNWTPQVRPILGIFDVLSQSGKKAGFAYNWEELRDLGRPGSLWQSFFVSMYRADDSSNTDMMVADNTANFLREGADFIFCYLGVTDEVGHKHGWMSPEYLEAAAGADAGIARVLEALPEGGSAIIMADHGGLGRSHGFDSPETMTIPLYVYAPGREAAEISDPDLLDIAPTIAALCGITAPETWEGRSLVK